MRRPRLPLVVAALLCAGGSVPFPGCGMGAGGPQDRPDVASTFPADGQILTGWLAVVRVTFDEPVTVLNEDSAKCESEGPDEGGNIPLKVVPDPSDPFSVLLVRSDQGHFAPLSLHTVTLEEGAVVNGGQHYSIDETEFTFFLGVRPNLFVTTSAGDVREIDPETGALVSTTLPPAGYLARTPFGTDERVWVWLDPTSPGSSLLGTFVPGDAAITETVALSGETGVVRGGDGFAISVDGSRLYAVAEDAGTNRAFVHRIHVPTRTEVGPSLPLSPALAGSPATFALALDHQERRLFVPFSDGAGGGLVALVDVDAWAEIDAGPLAGTDALPVPHGAGPTAYEWNRDDVYMALSNETVGGIVRMVGDGHPPEVHVALEAEIPGVATTLLALPDGEMVVYGLRGYPAAGREGLVRAPAGNLDGGSPLIVDDDLAGASVGSTDVLALVLDPADERFFVVAGGGSATVLIVYEWEGGNLPVPVDHDEGVAGSQALDLGPALGGASVTGGTTLSGAFPP